MPEILTAVEMESQRIELLPARTVMQAARTSGILPALLEVVLGEGGGVDTDEGGAVGGGGGTDNTSSGAVGPIYVQDSAVKGDLAKSGAVTAQGGPGGADSAY